MPGLLRQRLCNCFLRRLIPNQSVATWFVNAVHVYSCVAKVKKHAKSQAHARKAQTEGTSSEGALYDKTVRTRKSTNLTLEGKQALLIYIYIYSRPKSTLFVNVQNNQQTTRITIRRLSSASFQIRLATALAETQTAPAEGSTRWKVCKSHLVMRSSMKQKPAPKLRSETPCPRQKLTQNKQSQSCHSS